MAFHHLIIVASAIAAYYLYLYAVAPYNEPCTSDPSVPLFGNQFSVQPCTVFSDSYQQARTKFREAVRKHPTAVLHTLTISDDYTIDIGLLPGSEPNGNLVIHTSGTHGVEGYAGSAIQLAVLEYLSSSTGGINSLIQNNKAKVLPTIVLVHAVNPFGMAHYRRVNEHNVDLNRNGLTREQWKTYAANHFNRKNYDRCNFVQPDLYYSTLVNEDSNSNDWITVPPSLRFWWYAGRALLQYGHATLKAALVGGQYHDRRGIFYGGDQVEPSLVALEKWLQEELVAENDDNTAASYASNRAITWIDVHTGLGKHGSDALLMGSATSLSSSDVLKAFPGSSTPDGNDKDASDVGQGYERVQGFMNDYLARVLLQSDSGRQDNIVVMAQEFGTISTLLVAQALVLENAAWQASSSLLLEHQEYLLRDAFYPQSRVWRKQVLERGTVLFEQALQRD